MQNYYDRDIQFEVVRPKPKRRWSLLSVFLGDLILVGGGFIYIIGVVSLFS